MFEEGNRNVYLPCAYKLFESKKYLHNYQLK